MQVPTGILVDRFGPRRMLLAATLIMGVGPAAVLVGATATRWPCWPAACSGVGDAMTYISVLRLVAGWFPARRYPVMVGVHRPRSACSATSWPRCR